MREEGEKRNNKQSPNDIVTSLALTAIGELPQLKYARRAELALAYRLLENLGSSRGVLILEAYQAEINKEKAWEDTYKWHAAFNAGTARPQFRDPEAPDSPVIYPKNPEHLAEFIKGFVLEAVEIIQQEVAKTQGSEDLIPVLELDEVLKDKVLLSKVLENLKPEYDDLMVDAKEWREMVEKRSKSKFGDLRDAYRKVREKFVKKS